MFQFGEAWSIVWGAKPPKASPWRRDCWTYCTHNHWFRTRYRWKIWASLRKLFAPSGVQSWLRVCWWLLPCDFCQLCHSAQSFHNQIFQVWHQIWI